MSKFTKIADFKLPELPYRMVSGTYDFSNEEVIDVNVKTLENIEKNYGVIIKRWAEIFELGEPILTSFVAVESEGKIVGKNSAGAIGLTQVTIPTIIECVSKFKTVTGQPLPEQAVALLKEKAPYLLTLTPNSQTVSSANKTKLETLLGTSSVKGKDGKTVKKYNDPNLNIAMGALCLRWLLEFTKAQNLSYLQKAIIGYNQSAYGDISRYKGRFASAETLFKDKGIPKETRNYIVKVLGKNGYLELYVKNDI
jgi:soluble lytic murein transglycosylase-like protein